MKLAKILFANQQNAGSYSFEVAVPSSLEEAPS
jgi:hypothetical protein